MTADAATTGGLVVLGRDEVDHVASVLMAAWEEAEGKPVNVSYVATFADMARAVLAAGRPVAEVVAGFAEDEALVRQVWRRTTIKPGEGRDWRARNVLRSLAAALVEQEAER